MSVVDHIKDLISPEGREAAEEWAAKHFESGERLIACALVQLIPGPKPNLDELTPESRFMEVLQLSELERVQLVLAIERQFDVTISDEDGSGFQTLAQLVSLVFSKAQSKEAAKPQPQEG
jgi:acyl carrier protein